MCGGETEFVCVYLEQLTKGQMSTYWPICHIYQQVLPSDWFGLGPTPDTATVYYSRTSNWICCVCCAVRRFARRRPHLQSSLIYQQ
jgi:hypothetical protein